VEVGRPSARFVCLGRDGAAVGLDRRASAGPGIRHAFRAREPASGDRADTRRPLPGCRRRQVHPDFPGVGPAAALTL
jgi:hypothetical protein